MNIPDVRYVTTKDGYDIAYTVAGGGVPLVCMPSPLNHLRLHWRASGTNHYLYNHLAANFELIAYDSRGQGMSTRGLGDGFKIDDFEIDLEAIVDKEKLDKFLLLGPHGWGRVAVKFAEKHSDRLLGLILLNANIGDASLDSRYDPTQFGDLARNDWDAFTETIGGLTWASADPVLAGTFVREATTQADWLRRAQGWRSYNVVDSLPNIHVPTLVMSPSSETYTLAREESAKNIAERIPGARLELYYDPEGLLSPGSDTPPAIALILDFVRALGLPVAASKPTVANLP